ncbi:MAG: hypothetical protein POH28_08530, partial [Acidocella sp.]|nr:hypothetical protein [Acidocella sp.]
MKFLYLGVGCAMMLAGAMGAARGETMSPAVGKPLLAAEHMLAAHKYTAALADVAQADAAPGKTPAESLAIDQLRASIDAARGDHAAAAVDYAALVNSGLLSGAQVQQMAEAEASTQYQAGNYAGAIATIKTHLADDARFHPVLLQSYYQMGNCTALEGAMNPA